MLQGRVDQPVRDDLVHHSCSGEFAIRRGPWVFIDSPSGGDNLEPDWFRKERGYPSHDHPGELFNLEDDLAERVNRYAEQPELVAELTSRLREIQAGDAGPTEQSDPGPITA